jgi:hypothetical protein
VHGDCLTEEREVVVLGGLAVMDEEFSETAWLRCFFDEHFCHSSGFSSILVQLSLPHFMIPPTDIELTLQ